MPWKIVGFRVGFTENKLETGSEIFLVKQMILVCGLFLCAGPVLAVSTDLSSPQLCHRPCEGKHIEDKLSPSPTATYECKTFTCRNSKKEADLSVLQARVRDLDAQLNTKEADLATALNENRSLENDLRELKDQVVSVRLVPGISAFHPEASDCFP